jgi:phosphate:Na+ symporter
LAVFQAMFKVVGALVLVPLFYLELGLRIPAMQHLVRSLSSDVGHQMADVYFLFQLTAAVIVSITMTPIHRLLERLSPATPEEELTRPQFIYEQALEEPETALDLVDKEQLRLVRHLPEFLDTVREETAPRATVGPTTLKKAVTGVGGEVTAFVTDLMDRHQSRTCLERALNLQNRMEVIGSIADTLEALVSNALRLEQPEKLSMFTRQLAEALHVVLSTAYDAAEQPTEENRGMLLRLTADRGEMMEQIRRSFLGERTLNPASQQTLMTLTTHFERTIWLLRRFGVLLGAPSGTVK